MQPSHGYVTVSRRPPDVEDYIDIIRRYRSWIVGPLFTGLVVSVVVAFLWKDTFVSSAVMRITPQQVPERLVPSNMNMQIGERLNQMQQEILSRGSLIELIQRPSLDLYKKERQNKPMEDIVEMMRRDIRLSILETPSAGGRKQAAAFQISFSYPERYKAQLVVAQLVTKFTESNVNVERSSTVLTNNFLNDELNAAKANLDRLDKEITQFRTENAGRLPDQLSSNLQTVNSLENLQTSVSEAINRNSQEKMALETRLSSLRSQIGFYSSMASAEAPPPATRQVIAKSERLSELNRRI